MPIAQPTIWLGFGASRTTAGMGAVMGICFASAQAVAADSTIVKPLQLPSFKSGEAISFSYETKVHNETGGNDPVDSSLSEKFEIRVLNVTSDGARIDWTLRSANGTGVFERANGFYRALTDVPVEVQTDPAGIPQDIMNWDKVKDHYLAGAIDDNARKQALQAGEEYQKASASFLFSRILVTMAAMQGRDPIVFGHTMLDSPIENAPPPSPQFSVSRSIDYLGSDLAQCSARIGRKTTKTIQIAGKSQPPENLETTADVSTSDGWIINLHETRPGDPKFSEMTDIRRVTPNPC